MYKSKNHSTYSLKSCPVYAVKCRKKLINKNFDFFIKTKIRQLEARSGFEEVLLRRTHILARWAFCLQH